MGVRLATIAGRAVLLVGGGMIDVARASGKRFSSDPMGAFGIWDDFAEPSNEGIGTMRNRCVAALTE
jgi:hypothetical protein